MTMMGGVYVTCFFLFMRVCAISGDATERFVLRMKSGVLIAEASEWLFSDPQYVGALAESVEPRVAWTTPLLTIVNSKFVVTALVSCFTGVAVTFLPMLLGRL